MSTNEVVNEVTVYCLTDVGIECKVCHLVCQLIMFVEETDNINYRENN